MLKNIQSLLFLPAPTEDGVWSPVIIFEISGGINEEVIEFLKQLNSNVYASSDFISYSFKYLNKNMVPKSELKLFFTDRDDALLFKLSFDACMTSDVMLWIKHLDK